ncbi:hypothetical protein [Sinorhizobium fredii]|uniref:hypothetical protein n=1 Tax=Rhizobium fredii TaxID=380 RepID=UPI0035121B72
MGGKNCRQFDRVGTLHLSHQPGDDRLEPRPAQKELALIGECCRLVQPQQRLVGDDVIPLAHQDILDDPAFEMLDDLVLTGRDEAALGDDGGGQRRRDGPEAETPERDRHERHAGDGLLPDRPRYLCIPFKIVNFDYV